MLGKNDQITRCVVVATLTLGSLAMVSGAMRLYDATQSLRKTIDSLSAAS
jgi:hypothetical protein